jgi:hypothetical protein
MGSNSSTGIILLAIANMLQFNIIVVLVVVVMV